MCRRALLNFGDGWPRWTVPMGGPPPPIAAFAPPDAAVLTVGSLSKAAWGGLRIGWVRGPTHLIERIAELKAMSDLGSPLLEQAVAARIVPQLGRLRRDHAVRLRSH